MRYKGMKRFRKTVIAALCGVALISTVTPARAETVSQKQASKIAEAFFNQAHGIYLAAPKMVWNGRQLTTDRLFSPFYVYNHPKGGFVIVAADSKAYPILGYSKTGKFDKDRLTDEERELLTKYAHEIELIRYDSRVPERAVAAWGNLPLAINKVLSNPYDTPEYEALSEEGRDFIEAIDRRNNSVMLPSAIEFDLYDPSRYRAITLDDVTAEAEEIPFSFYEGFLEEIRQEEETRLAALDEIISPTEPVVSILGGAHYAIRFPVDIRFVYVYSLQGAKVMEKYYPDTETVNIDLSALPQGFYVLLALGDDGRIYGIKVYR